jgi:hypothetical protein
MPIPSFPLTEHRPKETPVQTRVGAAAAMRPRPLTPRRPSWRTPLLALAFGTWLASAALAQPAVEEPPPATSSSPAAVVPTTDLSEFGDPLITADELKAWTRTHGPKYRSALTSDNPSAADKDELTLGVKTTLYSLTLYERDGDAQGFANAVRSLADDLRRTTTKKEPRDHLNAEIVRTAAQLLDKSPKSRLNAVLVVASLSSDPAATPPKPYIPGFKLLLTVLNEPSQFVDCKIWAANGLARICRDGDPNVNDRHQIVGDLVTALDSSQAKLPANWWYRMRLLDALGDSGLVYNLVQKPVVIDALMKVLTDRQEDWLIRSTAARAVTQLPWTATTNVPLITHEIARLTHEMGEARNQNLGNPRWKWCIINVYMSFMPDTVEEIQKRWGLRQQVERAGLGVHKPFVEAAFQVVLPVINSVTGTANPVATPPAVLQNLGNWIQNNIPQNLKVTPESEDLKLTQPAPPPMAGTGNSTSWTAGSPLPAARRYRWSSRLAMPGSVV